MEVQILQTTMFIGIKDEVTVFMTTWIKQMVTLLTLLHNQNRLILLVDFGLSLELRR